MVDVGRYDGTSGSNFFTDKVGSDIRFQSQCFDLLVFTYGHIFHFRSYDTSFGIIHLGDILTFFGTVGKVTLRKTYLIQTFIFQTGTAILGRQLAQLFDILTFRTPFFADTGNTGIYIYIYFRVGKGTACVIDNHRIVFLENLLSVFVDSDGIQKFDFTHTHFYLVDFARDIYLFRCGIGNTHVFLACHYSMFNIYLSH